jgi:glycosyltransferase involved in cell wall biosynthesis
MEAMGAGRPVVGTALPGIAEVVGDAGSLVEPPDAEQLAQALKPYLQDPQLAARTGAKGRARVAERMTLDRTVADLGALYTRLAGEPAIP